ncbi:MAG: TAXI family TRAP transporter solute-binding subunit [Alphaproteobacteria bacterium]
MAVGGWTRAGAQEQRFFRIGTGPTGGTYFLIGGVLASVISNPPGSRPCDRGGSCGVPGLVALAQSTEGSVANLEAMRSGALDSGLCQADIANWAFTGTNLFQKAGPYRELRAIAGLYPESIHVVVRADGPIKKFSDLKAKRVSVGERNSGTVVSARIALTAAGFKPNDIRAESMSPERAADALREGVIDAFIFMVGYPSPAIATLAEQMEIRLIDIPPPVIQSVRKQYGFFGQGPIPANTYKGVLEVETLTIGAQWLTAASVDEQLVYGICKALWHESTTKLLAESHPQGKLIVRTEALKGVTVPLHAGAEKYYRDVRLIE